VGSLDVTVDELASTDDIGDLQYYPGKEVPHAAAY
jgi:hypothetical protein